MPTNTFADPKCIIDRMALIQAKQKTATFSPKNYYLHFRKNWEKLKFKP